MTPPPSELGNLKLSVPTHSVQILRGCRRMMLHNLSLAILQNSARSGYPEILGRRIPICIGSLPITKPAFTLC